MGGTGCPGIAAKHSLLRLAHVQRLRTAEGLDGAMGHSKGHVTLQDHLWP